MATKKHNVPCRSFTSPGALTNRHIRMPIAERTNEKSRTLIEYCVGGPVPGNRWTTLWEKVDAPPKALDWEDACKPLTIANCASKFVHEMSRFRGPRKW